MLIEEGSDKFATNKHGLNCLHIASQGDQPVSLYYFHKILKLNINEKDHRGSTPLHWAIFSCSELAMVYILAWLTVEELSTRDDEGYTAMHLAIKTSDKLENSRPVRALIYHGAATDIKDANGNKAIDIAGTLENKKIQSEIIKYLNHRTGLIEFLQYRNPLKKVGKSAKLPIAYFLFNLYIYVISVLFTMPLWKEWYEVIIVGSTFVVAAIFWIWSMCKNPGFI